MKDSPACIFMNLKYLEFLPQESVSRGFEEGDTGS